MRFRVWCRITAEVERNVVWKRKAEAYVFQTTFRHREGYSATTTRTRTLFLFYHGNKLSWSKICDAILIQNCRESCSLLHPRDLSNADYWFSFLKWHMFYSFNLMCKCFPMCRVFFVSSAINFAVYWNLINEILWQREANLEQQHFT